MKHKYKHGLTIMRCQPFHKGHERIINQMLKECENITIILGSTQEYGTKTNPFDYEPRKKMIQNVYNDKRINIFGLPDIPNDDEWADYVLNAVRDNVKNAGEIDVLYCGTYYDGHWFSGKTHIKIIIVDRTDKSQPYISASTIRDMWKYKDERWKDFIDKKNWKLIENFLKTNDQLFH